MLDAAAASNVEERVFDFGALQSAPLHRDPYDYLVVPGFVTPRALAAANRDFPVIRSPANFPPERLEYGAGFERMLAGLSSRDFAESLGDKFGLNLVERPMNVTIRKYCEASDGNIHTDHRSKILTALLYFNTEWADEGGRLRILRSVKNIEDYAAEVLPVGGTLLAFRRTGHSFHGHKRFTGERRMLQANWLKSNRVARYWQQFDRLSTHLMKRLLRSA